MIFHLWDPGSLRVYELCLQCSKQLSHKIPSVVIKLRTQVHTPLLQISSEIRKSEKRRKRCIGSVALRSVLGQENVSARSGNSTKQTFASGTWGGSVVEAPVAVVATCPPPAGSGGMASGPAPGELPHCSATLPSTGRSAVISNLLEGMRPVTQVQLCFLQNPSSHSSTRTKSEVPKEIFFPLCLNLDKLWNF